MKGPEPSIVNLGEKLLEAKNRKRLEEEKSLADKFERVLKGKFEFVTTELGRLGFDSNLPGVDHITIIPPYAGAIGVTIFYNGKNPEGKALEKHVSGSIPQNGEFSILLPRELNHLSNGQVFDEVLNDLKNLGLGKWISLKSLNDGNVPLEIIPPGDWNSPADNNENGDEKKSRAYLNDKRLGFFTNQQSLLFCVSPGEMTRISYGRGGKYGTGQRAADLTDYHGYIFPSGVMFENAVCENKIRFYNFEEKLSDEEIKKIQTVGLTLDEQRRFLHRVGFHVEQQKDKKQLRLEGKEYPENHPKHKMPISVQTPFYQRLQNFIDANMV